MVSKKHQDIVDSFKIDLMKYKYKQIYRLGEKPVNYRPDLCMLKIGNNQDYFDKPGSHFKVVYLEVISSNFSGFPDEQQPKEQFRNSIRLIDLPVKKSSRTSVRWQTKPLKESPYIWKNIRNYDIFMWRLLVDPKSIFTIGDTSMKTKFFNCEEFLSIEKLGSSDELFL